VKLLLLYLSFDIISRAIKTFDGSQANLRNWLNEVEIPQKGSTSSARHLPLYKSHLWTYFI
jgi:hypothetical protein